MQCQEIIAPVRSPYGHNYSPSMNDRMFHSDSSDNDSSIRDEPPLLIERRCVNTDSDSDDSDDTAATELSTVCSWDILKTDLNEIEVTKNNETMIVSLPPSRNIRIPMVLSTSPYEALVAAKINK